MDNGRSDPKCAQCPSLPPCPQHSQELNLGTGQEQLPCQENCLILTSKATVFQNISLWYHNYLTNPSVGGRPDISCPFIVQGLPEALSNPRHSVILQWDPQGEFALSFPL